MIHIQQNNECCGCSACANICPKKCIQMVEDKEGFVYPVVDEKICIQCNICNQCCPLEKDYNRKYKMKSYAAKTKDNIVREQSSSGGIFSILAKKTIEEEGIVFGAAFAENFYTLKHIMVDKLEDVEPLRGSKYFQSDISEAYILAKEHLKQGKRVLFSGTPCQIAGLNAFLKKKYDNLITVEVVCHGVPSPLFWKKYIETLEHKNKSKIVKVNFRAKNEGWKLFGLEEKYESGKSHFLNLKKNFYLKTFLHDLCLRPSCYKCKTRCVADLILGDLWGSQEIVPEMDDDKGLSLVLCNSKKGEVFWKTINSDIEYLEINLEQAEKYNPSIHTSVLQPKEREDFFNDLNMLSFERLENKYRKIYKKEKRKDLANSMRYYSKRCILIILKGLKLHK